MPCVITLAKPTSLATEEDLQLSLFADASSWEGLFDSIEIWRSRTTAQGPYEALTGDSWQAATLPRGAPPPPATPATGPLVTIVGGELVVLVGEQTTINIIFTGVDPQTYADVAAFINLEGLQLISAYVTATGKLAIRTVQVGTIASVRITGNDAAAILGFSTEEPDNIAFGIDARIPLRSGVTNYAFTDHNGDESYFYKTRFYNQVTRTTSAFSNPFSGVSAGMLDQSSLVRATVDLVDSSGVSTKNRAVLLQPKFTGVRVNGKTLVDNEVSVLTDLNGHAEFQLVRGQPFTVAIAGTDIVRDFTTPTDPTVMTFDMLDPAISSNDVFSVQQPNLDYATRRSL